MCIFGTNNFLLKLIWLCLSVCLSLFQSLSIFDHWFHTFHFQSRYTWWVVYFGRSLSLKLVSSKITGKIFSIIIYLSKKKNDFKLIVKICKLRKIHWELINIANLSLLRTISITSIKKSNVFTKRKKNKTSQLSSWSLIVKRDQKIKFWTNFENIKLRQ